METSPNVLVVDDEPPIRRLVQRMLRPLELGMLEAGDGESAMQILESAEIPPVAVILDLNLPDGSGKRWAERFHDRFPGLPIIYFSGGRAGEAENGGLFLKKPFTPDRLAEVVRRALSPSAD
jgi:DNA-binding NtrC family response regulator